MDVYFKRVTRDEKAEPNLVLLNGWNGMSVLRELKCIRWNNALGNRRMKKDLGPRTIFILLSTDSGILYWQFCV